MIAPMLAGITADDVPTAVSSTVTWKMSSCYKMPLFRILSTRVQLHFEAAKQRLQAKQDDGVGAAAHMRDKLQEKLHRSLQEDKVTNVLAKSGQIKVVAFDAPSRIVDDINTGLIYLAVAQHPAEIGYYGVMTAYAVLMKQSVPISIGTGFTVMDMSNIDDPEVSKYVYSA